MATPQYNNFKELPKALTFDVFGTTVTSTLIQKAATKLCSSKPVSLPPSTAERASSLKDDDWARFAQEWRNGYMRFTTIFVPGETGWMDIDTHHHQSLIELLKAWRLDGLYSDAEIKELSLIWHFLDPWSDSSSGLHKLGTKCLTSSLSNGNQSLLKDLDEHGNLGFQRLQSSADFKVYKPHPQVYLGAVKAMGLEPGEVSMVAAHLADLKAARDCGLKTIYVERAGEEDWGVESEEYADSKTWVDMWVKVGENGFVEVAKRFGIE
ncbi:S-2-haloacid dehalogenase 1 [Amylocarpus encephaloides]|uniref:S-2-haloacid dehalogenase 1 n=1 Tax=Amylocarpus encephaloides TaxID=45428 RepID=A0A9P7YQJ5_9HELO|nr:S-2-haloacid dehalogenase 1 [Amylocarpus encephaloides]